MCLSEFLQSRDDMVAYLKEFGFKVTDGMVFGIDPGAGDDLSVLGMRMRSDVNLVIQVDDLVAPAIKLPIDAMIQRVVIDSKLELGARLMTMCPPRRVPKRRPGYSRSHCRKIEREMRMRERRKLWVRMRAMFHVD
jgi:hypothetical protein